MSEGTQPPTTTASLGERRLRQRRMLITFCGLSLGLHIGLVAGFMLVPEGKKPAINLDDNIVKTRLVKLGKPRDEKLLPRLDASKPPPDASKMAPKLEEPKPDKQSPDATKKPSAADLIKKLKDESTPKSADEIIKERMGEHTDEGQLNGDKEGDALNGEIKKTYFGTLVAHIRKHMEVSSTITDDQRVRLKATLSIKVGADGEVLEAKIQTSSGSSVFDNDVITAAKRSSPVPAPPPQVRALVEQGVAFNFCPVSCS